VFWHKGAIWVSLEATFGKNSFQLRLVYAIESSNPNGG
jgi:hypothetical protein